MGVQPTELRHLCGRIGELYVALITSGRMATEVNQKGYDVISAKGEKISVKTTATSGTGGTINFNAHTLDLVDRVIVLRMNTDDMQIEVLSDLPVAEVRKLMGECGHSSALAIPVSRLQPAKTQRADIAVIKEVALDGAVIRELETGTIEVERDGVLVTPAKPELRRFAAALGLDLLNDNGNPRNTRQLGGLIIKAIDARGTSAN